MTARSRVVWKYLRIGALILVFASETNNGVLKPEPDLVCDAEITRGSKRFIRFAADYKSHAFAITRSIKGRTKPVR